MLPVYEHSIDSMEIYLKDSEHIPPHLHSSIEIVYVTEGSLALGIGQKLYGMETGDFAVVFPNLIHHYQVFGGTGNRALYILAAPSLSGSYLPTLSQLCPEDPVIKKDQVHPDILYCLHSLHENPPGKQKAILWQSFIQIILNRSLPCYQLVEQPAIGSQDIIYRAVSYIASHFQEPVTLTSMAHDLGISPYALSRVFSSTFHRNFNQYLNKTRLDYACTLLQYTDQPVTELLGNSGFDSQRTFNRVFRETYHMTPREYRKLHQDNS